MSNSALSVLVMALGLGGYGVAQADELALQTSNESLVVMQNAPQLTKGFEETRVSFTALPERVPSTPLEDSDSLVMADPSALSLTASSDKTNGDLIAANAVTVTTSEPKIELETGATEQTTIAPQSQSQSVGSVEAEVDAESASTEVNAEDEIGEEFADPYERMNRKVYAFNDTVDRAVTKPLARGYQKVVPKGLRLCASNMFDNLEVPYTAANNLLQGKPKSMFQDIGRLLVNSTLGIGGCFDIASQMGIPKHKEDFGQTLAVWGVPSGSYVVLPVLGASTVRDALAKPVDFIANPIGYISKVRVRNSLQGYKMVDTRSNLLGVTDALDRTALDPYVMTRDAWLQRRLAQVNDQDGSYDSIPEDQPRRLTPESVSDDAQRDISAPVEQQSEMPRNAVSD